MKVYESSLKRSARVLLGPLQVTSFETITGAIVDNLISQLPPNTAITELSDLITDTHLACIESFKGGIGASTRSSEESDRLADDGETDEIFPQSASQELLVYQFAGLAKRAYERLCRGLGSEFDMSASVQELRVNNWVSPVYARLQRRFVRFLAGNVDEKLEEIYGDSFDNMLEKVSIALKPAYSVTDGREDSSSLLGQYPVWLLSDFIIKIIRNSLASCDIPSIESKVVKMFQNKLSTDMRKLAKALEKMNDRGNSDLSMKDVEQIEQILNIGHASVSAVYCIWQIRHNIVGVPDEEGKLVKDFLRPVVIRSQGPDDLRMISQVFSKNIYIFRVK